MSRTDPVPLTLPIDEIAESIALFELGATKDTAQTIASRHGVSLDELGAVLVDPGFLGIVARKRAAMDTSPDEFKLKARAAVDEMFPVVQELFHDEATSAAVRKDIYREISRQAGYSGAEDDGAGKLPVVSLVIDLSGDDGRGQVLEARSTGKAYDVVE